MATEPAPLRGGEMSDLEMSSVLLPSCERRTFFSPQALLVRFLAQWRVERIRRRLLKDTLHELERLDAATLVDIGVLRTARQARWVDLGRGVPPHIVVDFAYETKPPHPPLNAPNLWAADWQP